jgi:methionyl-tRNA formyltransferase
MADGQIPAPESWRIVVFTNIPGGVIYSLVNEVVRPLGHRVVGVVTSPGPKRRRSPTYLEVVAAVPPGIDVIVSNHPERWAAMLAPLRPDLIISGGFPWRIPFEVIALPRLGAINMHPALLPRYRGPAAIEWALRNGDAELGFSVHRLAPDFDTGPILAQTRIPIADDDDINSLVAKFGPVLPGLLGQALERVARGDPGEAQDEAEATYAGLFDEEWRTIDWDQPARTIHNQVRSWIGQRDIPLGHWARSTARRCRLPRLACCQSSLSQVSR